MRPSKAMGAVCLIAAAALFAGCQASQPMDAAVNDAEPLELEAQPVEKPAPAKAVRAKKPVAKTAATTAAAASETSKTVATDAMPVMASRAVAPKQEEGTIMTTISGCLEQDGSMFRLKDTEGEDAPKARSWKSGFIRKGSAKIDVIDSANRLQPAHVGHRVSIRGTLVDREMHLRSVRATSERCD